MQNLNLLQNLHLLKTFEDARKSCQKSACFVMASKIHIQVNNLGV